VPVAFLECSSCGLHLDIRLQNTCTCGGVLVARYDWADLQPQDLLPRTDLWRYSPLLPLELSRAVPRGEGGTPLLRLVRLGGQLGMKSLYAKDEGRNPTGTFKARGMSVAVGMAKALGANSVIIPTAGNAGAAMAAYATAYGLRAIIIMASDGPSEALHDALAFGAMVFLVDEAHSDGGMIVRDVAAATGAFDLSTLREPYRVEGKKTMLFEIWDTLGGMPDWIVFPTSGGLGVTAIWKAIHELRTLKWHEGDIPRLAIVQASGCAPLVSAFDEGKGTAEPWLTPTTRIAGMRAPDPRSAPFVLRALYESHGAAVAVEDEEMLAAAGRLARQEGISACPEGGATLAGLQYLLRDGTISQSDRVVLMNTGSARDPLGARSHPSAPLVRSSGEVLSALDRTMDASSTNR